MRKIKKAFWFAVVLVALFFVAKTVIYNLFPLKYEDYIDKYSAEYGLDRYLVMGTIYAESGFNNEAHSNVAHGLMQLTDETAWWIAEQMKEDVQDIIDPKTNIKLGCYYLSYLIGKYNNEETALAAYNAGHGNVTKWLGDGRYSKDGKTLCAIPYEETANYVKRVKQYKKVYKKLYEK